MADKSVNAKQGTAKSVHAIVGGDDTAAATWLKNMNATLGAAPLEMIQTISGLNDVISYLGSRRAQI
jgi:Protein of unknown function (DUF2384)